MLRPYQFEANTAVEEAIAERRRQMLVAMATGTGKTFTMVNQVYRLMKSGVGKRILFLVDRRALAAQAVRGLGFLPPNPKQWSNEHNGLDLRGDLNLPLDTPLLHEDAYRLLPYVSVWPLSEIPVARKYLDRFRCEGRSPPSILAYTQEEWESRRRSGSSFRKAVERDAVRVV